MIKHRSYRRPMLLSDLLEQQFFLLRTRVRDDKTRTHYRRSVRFLGEMLGRPARVSDLTDDHLAGLLNWLRNMHGQSEVTANTTRKFLVCLWRWCRDRGIVDTGPTVAPLPAPARTPRAWRREELARLVAAAKSSQGEICGHKASWWWLTLLALEWDTGARATELLALRWDWIDWDQNWLLVPAECRKGKTRDACYSLGHDTLEHLGRHRRETGLILGWTMHTSRYYQLWNDVLDAAGLPKTRRNKTQMLRRTFATWLKIGGGSPTDALGHGDAATTRRSYLDPTLAGERFSDHMPFRLLTADALDGQPQPAAVIAMRTAR